jgi:hypothetical protein
MDWRCGSRGGVPALQVQRPEFKALFSHPYQKVKRLKWKYRHQIAEFMFQFHHLLCNLGQVIYPSLCLSYLTCTGQLLMFSFVK